MTLRIKKKYCSNICSGTFCWFGFFIGLSITDACVMEELAFFLVSTSTKVNVSPIDAFT